MTIAAPLRDPGLLPGSLLHYPALNAFDADLLGSQIQAYLGAAESDGAGGLPVKLSIVMIVRDQEAALRSAIDELLGTTYPCPVELIIVDDGSSDGTWPTLCAIADQRIIDQRVIVHRNSAARGRGAALMSALSVATGTHALALDVTLESVAESIPAMLAPVLAGRCDVVFGTRLFGGDASLQPYWRKIGNRVLTHLANIVFDAYVNDLHTPLKLVPLAVLRNLTFTEAVAGLHAEMTALLLRQGVRPFEVPLEYYSREPLPPVAPFWRHAAASMRIVLRARFRRRTYDLYNYSSRASRVGEATVAVYGPTGLL